MPFDHFNLIAGLYERSPKFNPPPEFLDILDLRLEGILLDAGGGTGRVADALKELVREVIVMDFSRGMLHYATAKGLISTCSLAERLPFAPGVFSTIIMMDALHHVINAQEVVNEFWRVLAPGGKIVVVEPNIHRLAVKLIAVGEKLLFMRSHFLTDQKISALFKNPGNQVRVVYNGLNIWICAERVRGM
jgi:ubiquinone/menaquinone biosynthesis C-methylase UbiE